MSIQIAGRGNNLGGPVAKISGAVIPPAVTYILDTLALVTPFACSTRKLRAAYAGPCMKVRRSSDNLEADIGFTAGDILDTAALLAHTGANSGFVTTWYDQSGNAKHLVQATAGAQPRIVNAGVVDVMSVGTAKPMVRTDGISNFMESGVLGMVQPMTRSGVLQLLSTVTGKILYDSSSGPENALYFSAAGVLDMFAGTTATIKTVVVNDTMTVTEIFDGAASSGTVNGVTVAVNPGVNGFAGVRLATSPATINFGNALYGDLILFTGAISAGNRGTLEANQKAWFGTP